MRRNLTSAMLSSALLLSACSGGPRWAGTVRDSAGIAIVENTDLGIWTTSDRWTLEEELKIGTTEGDPDYQFGQIGFLSVDSRGRLFVLDTQVQEIKVYSAEGRYEQTIGRQGAGPGELAGATYVLHAPGDTLFVPDIQNQRLNRYAPDGSVLESHPLMLADGLPAVFQAAKNGTVAMQLRPFGLPGRPALDSMDIIALLGSNGSITDTLLSFRSGGTFNLGGSIPEINLYSPEAVWALTDDLEVVYGVNDDYRIHVYSEGGVLERIITKPFERMPVSEGDRSAILGFLERTWVDAGVPPAALPQLMSIVHFGEFIPAFSSIRAGPLGTIWVQHIQTAAGLSAEELENYNLIEDAGAPDWDVFDSEGRYLGVVTMPPRFSPRLFLGNTIYGVWRDDLDVQYAVRYQIVGVPGDDTGAVRLGGAP